MEELVEIQRPLPFTPGATLGLWVSVDIGVDDDTPTAQVSDAGVLLFVWPVDARRRYVQVADRELSGRFWFGAGDIPSHNSGYGVDTMAAQDD